EKILYIGRATSLRDRMRSYFNPDLMKTRGPLLVDMIVKAKKIEYTETDSVLEAIILESNEIKKWKPYYNTKEKDNKSFNYVIITDEEFPRIILIRERVLDNIELNNQLYRIKYKFGPYTDNSLLKEALKIVRKIFPYRDEKCNIKYHELFYRSIGLSPDTESPEARKEYQKTIRNIVLFFQGKKSKLAKVLEKEMNEYVKKNEFEKANEMKKTLYALNHIQDISLIKSEKTINSSNKDNFRIEAYDIAHMSGKDTVGVMVVIKNGEINKNQYRKFKIKIDKNDDVAGLKEILNRRLQHTEWEFPDLIVIDGGINQLNIVRSIIKDIPIVSIVKDNNHRPDHFLGNKKIIEENKKLILIANNEAHRFAITYHKKLRSKNFL
ncbi:MAG TPA: hypothetical protein VI775_02495, partial [Candidatus Paceibacterota bacterium]